MKYLYGDSVPFPLNVNFLTTLEAFMTSATRIVELELHGQSAMIEATTAAQLRSQTADRLELFHTKLMSALSTVAVQMAQSENPLPEARDYTQRVAEFALSVLEEHKRSGQSMSDQEIATARAASERTRTEVLEKLEQFFRVADLSQSGAEMRIRLVGTTFEATALFANAQNIETSFELAPERDAAWTHPRKVSDFTASMSLCVGVKKSWLRGTVKPENLVLDDWILGEVELTETSTRVALRRKLAERDTLVLRFTSNEDRTRAFVEHPGDANAEALPAALDSQDLAAALPFANALRASCLNMLSHKTKLLAVKLDGTDTAGTSLLPLVQRVIVLLAPTVQEIARRSPNPHELSLKKESTDGRREEVYLRKEELVSKLQPLPALGRAMFVPLGLDTWVPGVTQTPPPVQL
jgi:hypothetical protein